MNIIINQLQKNFGPKVAVDIENYSIQSGNMLGLVGNNGACLLYTSDAADE